MYFLCVSVLCFVTAVINTTTHTTVVTTAPQQYPRQQVATPGQPPGYQYPSYQATPMQPGYGTQPMPQSYVAQPTVPYQGQPYTPGPPPTYQEASECDFFFLYIYIYNIVTDSKRGVFLNFLVMDMNKGFVFCFYWLTLS